MEPRLRPERLGREMFGGSPVGNDFTLTAAQLLWSCGRAHCGQLGLGVTADQLVLTLVAAEQFGGAQIVMVAAGFAHSVVLGAEGAVWTWGLNMDGQLGHMNRQDGAHGSARQACADSAGTRGVGRIRGGAGGGRFGATL